MTTQKFAQMWGLKWNMQFSQMNAGWPQMHCHSLILLWRVDFDNIGDKNANSRNPSSGNLRRKIYIVSHFGTQVKTIQKVKSSVWS